MNPVGGGTKHKITDCVFIKTIGRALVLKMVETKNSSSFHEDVCLKFILRK